MMSGVENTGPPCPGQTLATGAAESKEGVVEDCEGAMNKTAPAISEHIELPNETTLGPEKASKNLRSDDITVNVISEVEESANIKSTEPENQKILTTTEELATNLDFEPNQLENEKSSNTEAATDEEAALRLRSEDAQFTQLYAKWKGESTDIDPATAAIPKFYFKLPATGFSGGALAGKLREEARAVFLQRRGRRLLTNAELKEFWALLDSACPAQRDQMLSYDDFLEVARAAGPKCAAYLTASVFARLRQREAGAGRVSALALFNYVMRKVWHQQTRIGLSLYDVVGRGFLREIDLENYIVELVPTLPQLDGLERSFHSFYVCTAVRKFLFFLDPLRTGRVRIRDILACPFLDELLELRDPALPKEQQQNNWFSAPSALRVYGQYLNLDTDHNGMLSRRELQGYGTGTLTSVFMSRVFQECLTYDGEMDYKTYLDFVLAMEHRAEPQALHYLFKILDIDGQGFLTPFTLNFFFRAIQEQMSAHGQEVVRFEDVKDEIFDMVKPADPSRITLHDLIACGHGDTMVSILIDLNGFWTYENREAMACDTGDGSAQV